MIHNYVDCEQYFRHIHCIIAVIDLVFMVHHILAACMQTEVFWHNYYSCYFSKLVSAFKSTVVNDTLKSTFLRV